MWPGWLPKSAMTRCASSLRAQLPAGPQGFKADIDCIAAIAQKTGVVLEADLSLPSSPIRQYARSGPRRAAETCRGSHNHALGRGLEVMFVSEDATRSHPETLRRLFTAAITCGARRICLCDTVGHATPAGVLGLVAYVRGIVRPCERPSRLIGRDIGTADSTWSTRWQP